MLRRLYDRTLRLAGHRHATWWLLALAVAESFFFPIPIEALLLPMMFAAPRRCWFYAGVVTAGTMLGGVLGYGIGAFLFETAARPLLAFYGYLDDYARVGELYEAWGLWIVFVGGFTPIPYKVVAIASGALDLDIVTFLAASLASRGLRFFLEAALLAMFGPPIRGFVERHLGLTTTLAVVVAVLGFVALTWLW